ncbi:MAG: VWA domain-containing protein [Gammaproteobacteria bacterium]
MLAEFHFLRPLWLLALPALWALIGWQHRARRRGGVWQQVVDAELLPYLVERGTRQAAPWQTLAMALAALLGVVALAGPTWERAPVPVFREQSALVIAFDLSRSMNAGDVEPSRLAQAKFKVADLLRLRQDGQTALVVFAAQSFVVTPLTDDTATLVAQLRSLDTSIMPIQGSEPATALTLAADLLRQAGMPNGHVLLVTDGADSAGLERAAAVAAAEDLRVSVLGVGTAAGAPVPDNAGGFVKAEGEMVLSILDISALRRFAADLDGMYVELAADDAPIAAFVRHIDNALAHDAERRDDLRSSQWREVGPWLLLPLLPLVALGFRRGVLFALAIAWLPLAPVPVEAGWWRTDDQAAAAAFAEQDYATAAQQFTDPAWRGTARYRAGDYAQALADYAEDETTRGHYNRGNALARLGRYEEAVAAYERALEQDPALADAVHNKDLIEELLREQAPPEQQGQNEQPEQSDEERQSDSQQGENQDGGATGSEGSAENELSDGNAAGGEDRGGEQQAAAEDESSGAAGGESAQTEAEQNDSEFDEGDKAALAAQAQAMAEAEAEEAQATEQWLRQIPDDPAGLLRRKFQYQYKKRYGDAPYSGDRW